MNVFQSIYARASSPVRWSVDQIGGATRSSNPENQLIEELSQHGVAIVRGVIEQKAMLDLVHAAQAYVDAIRAKLAESDDISFPEKFRFQQLSFAADWVAVDPATRDDELNEHQMERTRLYALLRESGIFNALQRVFSYNCCWNMGRVRAVLAERGNGQKSGRLGFHCESNVSSHRGLHNLWIPLNRAGVTTNRDTSGLQVFVGARALFKTLNPHDPATKEPVKAKLDEINLAATGKRLWPDNGRVLRPEIDLGDMVIFDGFIPHASYIPPGVTASRVNFDIRLFPASFHSGPKPFPLA